MELHGWRVRFKFYWRKLGSKGGQGSHEQLAKMPGITETGGCTSGGKRDFRWCVDTPLDKPDSHKNNYSLFKLFIP